MAAGGSAIARDADGRVVFVDGALPGERVRARLVASKKDFARAEAVDVLEPSADRVEVPCEARRAGCGGCTWMHVDATAQVRLKADIVTDALRRIGRFGPGEAPVPTVGAAAPRSLRTTARLGIDPDHRAGQRRQNAHDVVATDACVAAHPRLAELIVDGRYEGATEVLLRVGVASGERAALAVPSGRRITVPSDVVVGGHAVVHEQIAGAWLQVSIGSFFQPGPVAAEDLVRAVGAALGTALPPGGHLVDAYAGVGLFGATLGRAAARVTAIESDPTAVADARINLAGLESVVFEGEVGRWRPRALDPPVDVVIADPARSGLGKPGVASVIGMNAASVILVSCDPASLARDARLLADGGYVPVSIELVDSFPDTFHVETVTRFDRIVASGR